MFPLFSLGEPFHNPRRRPPTEELVAVTGLDQAHMRNHPRGDMVVHGVQTDTMSTGRRLCPDPGHEHILALDRRQGGQALAQRVHGSAVAEVLAIVVTATAAGVTGVEVLTQAVAGTDINNSWRLQTTIASCSIPLERSTHFYKLLARRANCSAIKGRLISFRRRNECP